MKTYACLLFVLALPGLAAGATAQHQELTKALATTPDTLHGARLFHACVACHGRDGGGAIMGITPRISGQHYEVLVRQIIDFRYGKRWDFRMEDVANSHGILASAQDIADVAGFVSSMARDGARGIGDGSNLERGAAIYTSACVACHGVTGGGDERKRIPHIGGQHAVYLAREIYDAIDGRRPVLTRTHRKRFEEMSFTDILGLSDYISRMGWSEEPPARRERFEMDDPNPR